MDLLERHGLLEPWYLKNPVGRRTLRQKKIQLANVKGIFIDELVQKMNQNKLWDQYWF